MTALLVVILLIVGLAFAAFYLNNHQPSNSLDTLINPYFSKKPLTDTEAGFYQILAQAVPEYIVLAQVQLSRFIGVDIPRRRKDYLSWFNPIAQQSVDYLICRQDFSIVAAIELDDKSHIGLDAEQRDEKKTKNLKAADITLIRWHATLMPSTEQIRRQLVRDSSDNKTQSPAPWIADSRLTYFDSKSRNTPSPLIKVFLGLIFLLGMLLVINTAFKGLGRGMQSIVNLPSQGLIQNFQQQQAVQQKEIAETIAQKKALEDSQKQGELAVKEQALLKQQEEKHKAVLKEQAWNRYYKQSDECRASGNLVTCGNDYARARRKFELEWDAGKLTGAES
ncbi:MAG: DUF2726 domain-containing protein [Methylophilaceae bacterium]